MKAPSMRRGLLLALSLGVVGLTPAAHAAQPIQYSCDYHPEYPLRKYDCTGTAIEYGDLYCAAHWADDDSNGSWTDTYSRVYTVDCNGLWNYSCNELNWDDYSCNGSGLSPSTNEVCAVSWHDDEADPYYSTTEVTANTCYLLEDLTSR